MLKINGKTITADRFAFDGCHKIYLIENQQQADHAAEIGYKLLPIADLPEAYKSSCGLRFISSWGLDESQPWISYVPQFENARFSGFKKGASQCQH